MSENNSQEEEWENKIIDPKEESKKLKEILKEGLNTLGETFNDSYAYINLDARSKEIENLYYSLSYFPHIRYLNLSDNKIKDISNTKNLNHLVSLNISKNEIQNLDFLKNKIFWPFLQTFDISHNQLKEFKEIIFPSVKKLNLNNNNLSIIEIENFNNLKILEFRKNEIVNLDKINNNIKLKEIYGAENKINNLNGLKNWDLLNKLHLRNNLLENLENIADFMNIKYLNLRENKFNNLRIIDTIMKYKLDNLNLQANPFPEEIQDINLEILKNYFIDMNNYTIKYKIKILNKKEINEEEYNDIIDEAKKEKENLEEEN